MIKKLIRMFKQSQAVQRDQKWTVVLRTPNTYKLEFKNGRGKEHEFLPKIKECALTNVV